MYGLSDASCKLVQNTEHTLILFYGRSAKILCHHLQPIYVEITRIIFFMLDIKLCFTIIDVALYFMYKY